MSDEESRFLHKGITYDREYETLTCTPRHLHPGQVCVRRFAKQIECLYVQSDITLICLQTLTAWQFETGDACLPACRAGGLTGGCIVFVDVPERAVIDRIHVQGCVISPARIRCPLHT